MVVFGGNGGGRKDVAPLGARGGGETLAHFFNFLNFLFSLSTRLFDVNAAP